MSRIDNDRTPDYSIVADSEGIHLDGLSPFRRSEVLRPDYALLFRYRIKEGLPRIQELSGRPNRGPTDAMRIRTAKLPRD
jgi:hypothetical protein